MTKKQAFSTLVVTFVLLACLLRWDDLRHILDVARTRAQCNYYRDEEFGIPYAHCRTTATSLPQLDAVNIQPLRGGKPAEIEHYSSLNTTNCTSSTKTESCQFDYNPWADYIVRESSAFAFIFNMIQRHCRYFVATMGIGAVFTILWLRRVSQRRLRIGTRSCLKERQGRPKTFANPECDTTNRPSGQMKPEQGYYDVNDFGFETSRWSEVV